MRDDAFFTFRTADRNRRLFVDGVYSAHAGSLLYDPRRDQYQFTCGIFHPLDPCRICVTFSGIAVEQGPEGGHAFLWRHISKAHREPIEAMGL